VFVASNAVCTSAIAGGAGSYTAARWLPSIIFGVGAEQNFGAFFARGSVEAETIVQDTFSVTQPTAGPWTFSGSSSTPNTQWTARAIVMGGLRF
jgi:hypothetical protein